MPCHNESRSGCPGNNRFAPCGVCFPAHATHPRRGFFPRWRGSAHYAPALGCFVCIQRRDNLEVWPWLPPSVAHPALRLVSSPFLIAGLLFGRFRDKSLSSYTLGDYTPSRRGGRSRTPHRNSTCHCAQCSSVARLHTYNFWCIRISSQGSFPEG